MSVNIKHRQHKLEAALLQLGQLKLAIEELFTWMDIQDEQLKRPISIYGDPKSIEIELAKHKV